MSRSHPIVSLALALCAASPVFAQQPAPAPAPSAQSPKVAGAASSVTVTATVEAIDQKTREVTLRKENGELVTIVVGEEARNLAQVHKGDRVTATYGVGLVVALGPPGKEPVRVEDTQASRTPLGAKPGGMIEQTIAVTATVTAVDAAKRTVTLKGPRQTVSLEVAPDIDLSKVKVGDQVGALYKEALGLIVEAPKPAAK